MREGDGEQRRGVEGQPQPHVKCGNDIWTTPLFFSTLKMLPHSYFPDCVVITALSFSLICLAVHFWTEI